MSCEPLLHIENFLALMEADCSGIRFPDGLFYFMTVKKFNLLSKKFDQFNIDDENENILIKSTGWQDVNGQIIYEGDIITIASNEIDKDNTYIISYNNFLGKWMKCNFYIDEEFEYENLEIKNNMDGAYASECYVIGNIFENPEILLKLMQYA